MDIATKLRNFYSSRTVLVTGGASFIGSHLVELLVESGAKVTVADDLSSGRKENLDDVAPAIEFLRMDLRNPEHARAATKGKRLVFHLAAQHGGRGYIDTHPVECVNNMLLDNVVFSAAARNGVKKIVHASSACVYPTTLQSSETDRGQLRESDANFTEPGKAFSDGEYGWAKFMGELQLRAFFKEYGVAGVACRIFTAYGERENESHAVIALIAKAAARLDPYPVWGSGLQTRNFTYVGDTVTGLALAGATYEGFQTVNVGSSRHHTVIECMEEIFSFMHWRPATIKKEPDKPVGVLSRAADNTQCLRDLGWEPRTSLTDGIARTAQWYLDNSTPERLKNLQHYLLERG